MPKFRKKPVVIEAVRWTGENYDDLDAIGCFQRGSIRRVDGGLPIRTLEGEMVASVGDWIIRGIKGELYPCKPDIFDATYEAV